MRSLNDIKLSFYSSPFYTEVAHERRGIGLMHVWVLTLVMLAFLTVELIHGYPVIKSIMDQLPDRVNSFPAITYKDYKITLDKPTPYRERIGSDPDQSYWFIIDPNFQPKLNELPQFMKDNKILAILTNDQLIFFKEREGKLDINDLKNWRPFTMTHDDWRHLGDLIHKWGMTLFLSVVYFTMLCAFWIGNLLAAIGVGVIVKLVALVIRADYDFAASIRLAAALRMPYTIIVSLPVLVSQKEVMGVLAWLLWFAYIGFASWSAKQRFNQLN